jgi:anti-sigma B factor antagonist
MANFNVNTDLVAGDVCVLHVSGEVDFDAAPQFKRQITSRIDAGERRIVVDLSCVTFIDSTAIGVLIAAIRRLEAAGGSLSLACANDEVRGIFEAVGLENVVALHLCTEDACAALAIA